MNKKEKVQIIFKALKKKYPDARIELNFKNPLELLIATILSAQCTDVRVNEVTKELFRSFKKPEDYLAVPQEELENKIRQTGFFRQKAKSIRGAMQAIIENFKGKVPNTIENLVQLPGVGRKTANVVLGNAFNIPGLPVDTHVTRVSNRLGLVNEKDAEKIETELNNIIHPSEWALFSHTLIFHGRYTCKARKPLCQDCPIKDYCNYHRGNLS